MPPCPGIRVNVSRGGCQWQTGDPQNLRDTPCRPLMYPASQPLGHDPSVLKRIGTNRAVSHIVYNSESILGRNDSPLSCLHWRCFFSLYIVSSMSTLGTTMYRPLVDYMHFPVPEHLNERKKQIFFIARAMAKF